MGEHSAHQITALSLIRRDSEQAIVEAPADHQEPQPEADRDGDLREPHEPHWIGEIRQHA